MNERECDCVGQTKGKYTHTIKSYHSDKVYFFFISASCSFARFVLLPQPQIFFPHLYFFFYFFSPICFFSLVFPLSIIPLILFLLGHKLLKCFECFIVLVPSVTLPPDIGLPSIFYSILLLLFAKNPFSILYQRIPYIVLICKEN